MNLFFQNCFIFVIISFVTQKTPETPPKGQKKEKKRAALSPCTMKKENTMQNIRIQVETLTDCTLQKQHNRAKKSSKNSSNKKVIEFKKKEETDKNKNIFHFYPILFAHKIFLLYLCIVKQKDHVV